MLFRRASDRQRIGEASRRGDRPCRARVSPGAGDRHRGTAACVLAAAAIALCGPWAGPAPAGASSQELAQAERVIDVGPSHFYRVPSEAANVVQDGYTVRIEAGEYVDCASWRANGLTIIAVGGDVHVRDRACESKGIWVVSGDDIVIDGITFSGARVPDENGAGIRAQGRNLTVRNARFYDNQMGILANPVADSTIVIEGSVFERNGRCGGTGGHGIYALAIARLQVLGSTFRAHCIGHHIKSRARVTEVSDSVIEDGPDGTASYLIDLPNGGTAAITGNTLQKGPLTDNRGTAIFIGAEGDLQPSDGLLIADNVFRNDGPTQTVFVHNATPTAAVVRRNRLQGSVVPLEGPGELVP